MKFQLNNIDCFNKIETISEKNKGVLYFGLKTFKLSFGIFLFSLFFNVQEFKAQVSCSGVSNFVVWNGSNQTLYNGGYGGATPSRVVYNGQLYQGVSNQYQWYNHTGLPGSFAWWVLQGTCAVPCTNASISAHPNTSAASTCLSGTAFTALSVTAAGSATLSYQWQSSSTSGGTYTNVSGATSASYTPVNTTAGTLYYRCVATTSCNSTTATSNISGAHTVTAANTAGTASSTPTLCINTALTNITRTTTGATGIGTATGLPSGVTAAWASNTITISGTPTASGPFSYSIPLTGGCGSVNAIGTITVTALPTITGTTPASVCGSGTLALSATASAGTISWWAASTGGTALATGTSYTTPSISTTTTYYVSATDGTCTSSSRTAIAATVTSTLPTITGTTPASRCGAGTVALSATASAGTISWWAASTGGVALATGTSYTTPSISSTTTYYVSTTSGTCTSASRTAIAATVSGSAGPGGVTDQLSVWLKADAGTSSLSTSWQDQGCNARNYTTVSGPTVISNDINFNPAIEILSGGFNGPAGAAIGTSWTLFSVHRLLASDDSGRLIDGSTGNVLLGNWGTYTSSIYWGSPAEYDAGIATTDQTTRRTTQLFTYQQNSTTSLVYRLNGDEKKSWSTPTSGLGVILDIDQGAQANEASDARISEFIIYNKALSASEILKVEAYLAAKYGLTLSNADGGTGGDFVSSGGTTYWDASANTGYSNEVVVIGKDNNTALVQKQAKSTDDSLRVFVSTLAASNSTNAGTITNDQSFIALGHNGAKIFATAAVASEKPAGIYSRFAREWKIVNTNFSNTFSLEIEWDSSKTVRLADLRLLVDDDGDFSNATAYSSANGLTFSFGSIIISGISTSMIPLNSTRFITVASADAATPLPVNLFSFDAVLQDAFVMLEWTTASEINNDHFVLEKSEDGVTFTAFAQVNGAGNSNTTLTYSNADVANFSRLRYYRLSQVDFDGKKETFKIVSVSKASNSMFNVVPNPMKEEVSVLYPADEEGYYRFTILSDAGQELHSALVLTMKGENSFKFNTSSMAPGAYIFSIKNVNGFILTKKVVKYD